MSSRAVAWLATECGGMEIHHYSKIDGWEVQEDPKGWVLIHTAQFTREIQTFRLLKSYGWDVVEVMFEPES